MFGAGSAAAGRADDPAQLWMALRAAFSARRWVGTIPNHLRMLAGQQNFSGFSYMPCLFSHNGRKFLLWFLKTIVRNAADAWLTRYLDKK